MTNKTEYVDSELTQIEKRRALLDDQRVARERAREQASTLHQHAIAEASLDGGRYGAVEKTAVTAAEPVVQYPAAASWTREVPGVEPPLNQDVNFVQPCGEPHEIMKSLGETGFPSPGSPDSGAVAAPASSCADVCETAAPLSTFNDDEPPPRAA
jgi:hypothetical protein